MSKNIKFNIELSVDGKKVVTQVSMSAKELAETPRECTLGGDVSERRTHQKSIAHPRILGECEGGGNRPQ